MKKLHKIHNKTYLKLSDAICSALSLLLGLQLASSTNPDTIHLLLIGIFLTIGLSNLFNAFSVKDKTEFIKNISLGTIYLAYNLLLLVFYTSPLSLIIAAELYFLGILTDVVLKLTLSQKTTRTIIKYAFEIILLSFFIILLPLNGNSVSMVAAILSFAITIKSLLHIILTSFSQINISILRSIIRKTYASEILFGLTMLIISFSFVFEAWEPDIHSYSDALWYCFAIITTIGFGDITVTSGFSRVLSVILGIYGIIVVALITSIIVNFYNEVKDEKDDNKDKNENPENPITEQTPSLKTGNTENAEITDNTETQNDK